jgi:Domain of unknown function (DUF222)/HNH endonuclease
MDFNDDGNGSGSVAALTPRLTWEELQQLARSESPLDWGTIDRLGEELVRCEVLQAGAIYQQLLCLRVFDAQQGWTGFPSCEAWLTWNVGWNYKTANERLRVARALAYLPLLEDALQRGELSYTKVRAIYDVATPDNEKLLVDQARWVTGEQLRRLVAPMRRAMRQSFESHEDLERRRRVRFLPQGDGMVLIEARLLPEEAAQLRQALEVGVELGIKHDLKQQPAPEDPEDPGDPGDPGEPGAAEESAAADQRPQRFGFPDALGLMVESFLATPPHQGVPLGRREMIVHTVPDLSEGTLPDGTRLLTQTVRRLACDSPRVVLQRGAEGEVLDVGRRTRRISRRLERALLARDGCCRFPGCTNRVFLDAHHVEHWADGGRTKLSNLLLVCRLHHRLVHEGQWRVRQRPDGCVVFLDPRGGEHSSPPRLPAVPARSAHQALEEECLERGIEPQRDPLLAISEASIDYAFATMILSREAGFDPYSPRFSEPAPAIRWLRAHGARWAEDSA